MAIAGASAEPLSPPEVSAKTEAKAAFSVGEKSPLSGQATAVATEADTRAKNLPEGAERSSILMRDPCAYK